MIGSPVPLVENVFRLNSIYTTNAVISDSGTLVYIPGRTGGASTGTLVWVNREGHEEPLGETADIYNQLKISPDGKQVALSITVNGNEDIYIYDLSRGTKTRLTLDDADDYCPVWTPDGKWIIFCSARGGRLSIFRKSADGMGKAEQLASWPGGWMFPYSLSSNGSMLFFVQVGTDASRYNIGILSMTGDDRTPKLLLHEEYDEEIPMISPDGRWLAYASNESGRWEIFIRSFPDIDSGEKRQVSAGGGEFPSWSPDGRELFYQSGDTTMVVSVETAPILSLGTPQKLFSGPYLGGDISPDGKRFLMIKAGASSEGESISAGPRKINIVLNWFEELKQRVPVK